MATKHDDPHPVGKPMTKEVPSPGKPPEEIIGSFNEPKPPAGTTKDDRHQEERHPIEGEPKRAR